MHATIPLLNIKKLVLFNYFDKRTRNISSIFGVLSIV